MIVEMINHDSALARHWQRLHPVNLVDNFESHSFECDQRRYIRFVHTGTDVVPQFGDFPRERFAHQHSKAATVEFFVDLQCTDWASG